MLTQCAERTFKNDGCILFRFQKLPLSQQQNLAVVMATATQRMKEEFQNELDSKLISQRTRNRTTGQDSQAQEQAQKVDHTGAGIGSAAGSGSHSSSAVRCSAAVDDAPIVEFTAVDVATVLSRLGPELMALREKVRSGSWE